MHEVIHLSLSTEANHLHAHFYNAQHSYFSFDQTSLSEVDPNVLFQRRAGFTPRALIWDFRHAFHKEPATVAPENLWNNKVETLQVHAVGKSEFVAALDQGNSPPVVGKDSSRYWTDYFEAYYDQRSLNTLTNWEYNASSTHGRVRGHDGDNQTKGFDFYDTGCQEWAADRDQAQDYLDERFRPVLEECDGLSGVSVTTVVDSAWGGYSSELLAQLRDDYLGKSTVMTWGLYESGLKSSRDKALTSISGTLGLVAHSDLYIPVSMHPKCAEWWFARDPASHWQTAAIHSLVFEPVSVLSSLRGDRRVSMQSVVDSLTQGTSRTIVGSATVQVGHHLVSYTPNSPFDSFGRHNHVFSALVVNRSAREPKPLNLMPVSRPALSLDTLQSSSDQDPGYPVTMHTISEPPPTPITFPADLVGPSDKMQAKLEITDGPYHTLQAFSKQAQYIRNADDREATRDELANLAAVYASPFGYDSDSDYD